MIDLYNMGFAPQRIINFVNKRFVLVENLADPNKKMTFKPISLDQLKQYVKNDYIELTYNAKKELEKKKINYD